MDKADIQTDRWKLPGLEMDVKCNVDAMQVITEDHFINVVYQTENLDFKPQFEFAIQ